MKKIICFTDSLSSGGAQRQLVGLACMLKEHGYDVSVLLYYDIPFYKPILDSACIESVVIRKSNYIKRIWKIYKYFRRYKKATIIAYQDTPSIIACLLRPFIDCRKLIVSERNTTQHISYRDKIKFWLWRYADFIVPNSHTQTDFIIKHNPKCKDKVITITNFVDINKFIPKEYTKHSSKTSILTIARITPQKNVMQYIESAYILKCNGVDFECHWYGNNDNEEYYKKCNELIEIYKLQNHFYFHPATSDIIKQYQSHDVFCLPSIYEGFPNVICEAMACGKPVLCSNVCDNPHIVHDGDNGILFNPNNVNDIVASIVHFIDMNSAKKERMAKRSRYWAEQMFSDKKFIEKYKKLIR